MKLIFDTDTSQLIIAEGFASPVALLEAKRGTGAKIQLTLLRDGQAWTAPALSQFRFIVKPWGKYEVDQTCALAESWTLDSARKSYEGRINYATDKLNELLKIADPTGENTDTGRLSLMAEFAWRETDSVAWGERSHTVEFLLHNNVWRGTETIPGAPASVEGSALPLLAPVTVAITSNVINSHATANTLIDVTGLKFPVLSGRRYSFKFVIPYNAAAATTGSRWSINGPALSQLHYSSRYTLTAITETVNYLSAYNLPSTANLSSLTSGNLAVIEGTLTAAADGEVIARFASEIASSSITALAGAHVIYMVLPTV
jgi:hypothetical protein